MNAKVKEILFASSILFVLALCLPTGQAMSPFRFLYFPLVILLALRTTVNTLLIAGFTFTMLFAFIAFYKKPPDREAFGLAVEVVSYFLFILATGFLVRVNEAVRKRGNDNSASFQLVNGELKQKSLELDNALDSLSRAHRQMLETTRSRNRFLTDISSELNAPLSAIRYYSEKLLDYGEINDGKRREFVQAISGESERITRSVNNHLDMLMIEAVNSGLNPAPVNPALLIDVGVKVVSPMADRKGIALIVDIPQGLPPARGDQNHLTQVLVNLLNNAVERTSKGRIKTGVRHEGNMLEFFVEDSGEGIVHEKGEIIIEMFSQLAENSPNVANRTSLGLSISKRIIDLHGGGIWVESTPGKGSTFTFSVPVYTEEVKAAQSGKLQGTASSIPKSDPILVQSESIVTRQSLRKLLENLGYKTIGADTPGKGLEVAVEIKPALIISDNLGASGEFVRLGNWARDEGVNIVLATLHIDTASGDLGVVANGYLKKPFDRFQILSTIERFVTKGGLLFIISPEGDEAKKLQFFLESDGYSCVLFMEETETLKPMQKSLPDGVVIGSFSKDRMGDVIATLMKVPGCSAIPFFLLQDEVCARFAVALTLRPGCRRNDGNGLSPLITMIGNSLGEEKKEAC